MINLAGKTAFVTGGAGGIGMGMVGAFLGERMRVVIADVKPPADVIDSPDVLSLIVDVTDAASVAAGVAAALERFGSIDVVCANAGIGGGGAAVADPELDGWDRVMAVNLDGVVHTIKQTVPSMRARAAGGHVVITSSVAGITALPFEHGAYTTAKFAVRGLGESLRLSLAEEGIGVSILCPGLTDTGILGGDGDETVEFSRIDGAMNPLEVGYAVVRGMTRERSVHLHPRRVRRRVPGAVRRARRRRTCRSGGAH